jgi:polyhydroxyalkanoate synthesis regulator phasin
LICLAAFAGPGGYALAATSTEEQSLTELRNTVVNLLKALVERGVLTREQAEAMVHDAQTKAQAESVAKAAAEKSQEEADKGAVRVPYVPQIVKDEIRKEVVAELGPSVKKEVVAEINSTGSLRSALPDWVQRMRWTGDIRVREEGDLFAKDNATNAYLDFNTINSKGGLAKAGIAGLLNTSEDRDRLRLRLRFGFDTDLGSGWTSGMRLATGTGTIYTTTNQTLGTYGARYQIGVDQGFIRWTGQTSTGRQIFSTTAGRFANPWLSTDLVWYSDLTFEGLASTYRFNLGSDSAHRHDLFATIGGFPLQDAIPSKNDKWLLAGQIGADFRTQGESRFRFGAAYYDYVRIVGQRNAPESTLLNYTAPPLLQKGNTLFDMSNTADRTVNLYGLAADYKIVDLTGIADFRVLTRYNVSLTGQAVQNVGFKSADVAARVGGYVAPHTRGYRADLGFGSATPGPWGTWRAAFGYRYLERDAVLDAFNDQDFHLGGTDAKGYTISMDFSFNPRVMLRAKYFSANAIDGPPLGIDVWQVDLNTQF